MQTASRADSRISNISRAISMHRLCYPRVPLFVSGYAQLVQGLTRLSNIGRCDQFGEVMEFIAKQRSHAPSLQIKHLHTRDMTFHQLHLTVTFCPLIEHVNLYVDEDLGHLLSPLSKLQNLKELHLLACNFHSDKVKSTFI